MPTAQPIWKFLANLGDADPIGDGGLFVYVDETGVYPPEMERCEPMLGGRIEIRRVVLEPCTFQGGVLSDNKFHPQLAAWFAWNDRGNGDSDLQRMANTMGRTVDEYVALFTSENPVERATAWRDVGDYFGWDNLDSYPFTITAEEAEARYAEELA